MLFVFFTNSLILFALRGVHTLQLQAKYRYSRLSNEEKNHFKQKIRELMENSKPYLDPLLSLDSMALSLGVSSKALSQILNECFTLNFADFINSFRVQEAMYLLKNDTQNRTILNISLDAGFNAKSTFNLVFKKHTGVSPREFIKNAMQNTALLTSE
jgi:AraC-like DNA-binding protein